MRKTLFFLLLLLSVRISAQQDDAPVVGVSDKRIEVYGLKNARIVVDYQTTLENTDILISDGRIETIGTNLTFPKGTIIYDLTGKTVYPSFVDSYAGNFGIKTQAATSESNSYAAFFGPPQTGRAGAQVAMPEARIADYWNDGINASYDISTEFIPDAKIAAEYRQAGFGAVVAFKSDGIARGTSALVSTADGKANSVILKNRASANYSFTRGRSSDLYPASQFGIIALLRQVNYDVQWYKQLPVGYFHDNGLEAYTSNLALPQLFEATNKLEILRADKIGKEFGINYIIKGSGDEYQTLNDIKKAGNKLIIPVSFPEAPDVKDPYDAASVTYTTLKHYELAPSNLSRVSGAGVTFAITSSDLKQRSGFLANMRKAVRYGLSETEALKALTYTPASYIGASDLVGTIKKNMIANLLITSGDIFSDDCVIYENWVQGIPYRLTDLRIMDLRGTYALKIDTVQYKMVLSGTFDKPVNSLIHFNEGYKIADQIAANGAAASVFSDWWDYKYEVYEGIAYNAALLLSQGVLVCINSDDAEMGRRLNQEAAKIMKYGGISETEALKLVTINPAVMLHLGDRTGSIKVGKDADLVLWTDYPLSVYAQASKTMVDGTIYFDEEQDAKMKEQIDSERNRIIANILRETPVTSSTTPNFPRR
jgi:imidazolonepropionase-like amidohydrolase